MSIITRWLVGCWAVLIIFCIPFSAVANETLLVHGKHLTCIQDNAGQYLSAWESVIFIDAQNCPENNPAALAQRASNFNPNITIDKERTTDVYITLDRSQFECLVKEFNGNNSHIYQVIPEECSIIEFHD